MVTTRLKTFTIAALASTFLAATAGSAFATPAWNASHSRRAEVNRRLGNENSRIDQDRQDGSLSHGQARQLHHEDHQIRQEERAMASQDGGHITRADQAALNQQENGISRQIYQDR
jgi:hypothetical protein